MIITKEQLKSFAQQAGIVLLSALATSVVDSLPALQDLAIQYFEPEYVWPTFAIIWLLIRKVLQRVLIK